jgi:hypothetical protein
MPEPDDLLAIERALWLEGADRFRTAMAEDALMVFPAPAGILRGQAILDGLAAAPRWESVAIEAPTIARPGPDCAVLAYRATARRTGGPAYRAFCSSTYIRRDGAWRIVQHQHTPDAG